ncbi:MAG TPA: hypothetical protein VMH86_12595 [Rhizomicrobium sp.]|nr:hypothetical protein [Rhizomicrobium sp.]
MDPQHIDWHRLSPYLVPILVVALVARRLIRNAPTKVKPGRLFIAPAIAASGTVATLSLTPIPPFFWMVGYALALAAGVTIGYLTAHHQEYTLDPETGTISSRATPIGTMLIAGLFVVRYGLKFAFPQLGAQPGAHPGADVLAWTDAGLIFSTGLVTARAAIMWMRARPLMLEHRAGKLTPPG